MKISSSTHHFCPLYGDAEGIRMFKESGFDAIEYDIFHYPPDGEVFTKYTDEEFKAFFTNIGKAAADCGIEIHQVHAPFPLKTGNPEIDPILLSCAIRSVYATAYMGSRYVVIHACAIRNEDGTLNLEEMKKANFDFYTTLLPHAKKAGVTIAIENMRLFLNTPETLSEYIDELNEIAGEKVFCACLDTGHAYLAGKDPGEFLLGLGKRVEVIHVQDSDGVHDLHTIPGLGQINWKSFADALKEVGYEGTFNFEADHFVSDLRNDATGTKLDMTASKLMCELGHAIING